MQMQQKIQVCLNHILRIAQTLVPDKEWHTLYIEASILGSVTAVKAWYSTTQSSSRTEYSLFDLDYINEDNENNMVGTFVEQLRDMTYDPARGAWYIAHISFHKNIAAPVIEYNYFDEPKFRRPMPPAAYKNDLKVYPRPAHLIPNWLQ